MLLADDISPIEYRFTEVFKKSMTPSKKSDFFSSPSISIPNIALTKNGVKITFQEDATNLYRYRIERHDYITHTTIYEGDFLPDFLDTTIEADKRYIYTITPMYADKLGQPIQLPEIFTIAKDTIIEEEWWKY